MRRKGYKETMLQGEEQKILDTNYHEFLELKCSGQKILDTNYHEFLELKENKIIVFSRKESD